MSNKFAFTLAETLIVLVIIGILTAILLPVAFHSSPDENLMKFKKAHSTFYTVIRELVNSDEYYANGYLGEKADGTPLDVRETAANHETNRKYFCESIAQLLSVKSVNCSNVNHESSASYIVLGSDTVGFVGNWQEIYEVTPEKTQAAQEKLDKDCKNAAVVIGAEIITPDNVVYYQTKTRLGFGAYLDASVNGGGHIFAKPGEVPNFKDQNGFDVAYKEFCIDVDGINKGIAPFGYGIRGDGKILNGERANAWINAKKAEDIPEDLRD